MNLKIKHGLPFTAILISHRDKTISIDNVLVDTGSASTIIAAEIVIALGLGPEPFDVIKRMRGIGGTEYVYEKHVNKIQLGTRTLTNFKIQVGDMDYGFDINGILGMDYLIKSKVVIDLENMILV